MNRALTSWYEPGHVAIVTGASKGFGYAVARELARRGIALGIVARHADEVSDAAARLRDFAPVEAVAGDVADPRAARDLVERVRARFGRIDLLVNNASTLGPRGLGPLESALGDDLARTYAVNALAPLRLMQLSLPDLMRTRGTIVNVTSDAAIEAYRTWGGYGASKAALEHLSRTFAAELDGFGVSIVVADPGGMDTEMHRAAEPGEDLSGLPAPEDVAPALLDAIARSREPFVRVELQAREAVAP